MNSYKAKMESLLKKVNEDVRREVSLQILNAMGGDYLPEEIRNKKLKDLEDGHYNDQVITIMPGYKPNLDIEESFLPQKPITKTVKEIGTFLVNGYSEKLSRPYHNVDVKK